MTDSKSVGSDTVRVQVPPSAPRRIPPIDKGYFIGRWFLACTESVVNHGFRVVSGISEGMIIDEKTGIFDANAEWRANALENRLTFALGCAFSHGGVHRVLD